MEFKRCSTTRSSSALSRQPKPMVSSTRSSPDISAKFLWKFKDSGAPATMRHPRLLPLKQDNNYIITHGRAGLKDVRVVTAEATSLKEDCMNSFLPMQTNRSLRLLPDKSFHGRGEQAAFEPVDAVAALTFVSTEKIYSRTKCSNAEVGTRTSTSSIRPTRQEK